MAPSPPPPPPADAAPPASPLQSPPDALIDTSEAINYWQGIDADVNGMLGGYPYVSRVDLQGSRNFVAKLRRARGDVVSRKLDRAVDCGAG